VILRNGGKGALPDEEGGVHDRKTLLELHMRGETNIRMEFKIYECARASPSFLSFLPSHAGYTREEQNGMKTIKHTTTKTKWFMQRLACA
jgi:hypothetical protein